MAAIPSVTFETSTLASVVAKAARVAPTKGAAYDKAAGIVMEIDPDSDRQVTFKSTDLEITYLEWVTPLNIDCEKQVVRVPSALFHGVLSGFPLGTEVKLEIHEHTIILKSGKKKATINRVDPKLPYMSWEPFDQDGLVNVPGFSKKVSQVSWCCDRDAIPLTGVYIDGEYLTATDRFRAVRVPCEVPVDAPIAVPLGALGPIFSKLTDASLAAQGEKLLLMPDEYTQITSVIFMNPFPDMTPIINLPTPQTLTVPRQQFIDSISAMMVLCKADRYPRVTLTIGTGRVHIYMNVPEVGRMEDEIEVNGADHEDFEAFYTPTYLTDAMAGTDGAEISFSYDPARPISLARFTDGDYSCWISARRKAEG